MAMYEEPLRRALVAVRQQLPQEQWDAFAEAIVRDRQHIEGNLKVEPPSENFRHLLDTLRNKSYVRLPGALEDVASITAYIKSLPAYTGPHPHTFNSPPMKLEQAAAAFPVVCHRWQDVIRAPGLVDQLNDPRIIDLIESYLGCVPTLYSVNAFWYFPFEKPSLEYLQSFHRDTDDWRFVALFIYLTDVDDESGPHQVIPGTHSPEAMRALAPRRSLWESRAAKEEREFALNSFTNSIGQEFADKCERYLGSRAETILGDAGSMFLVNTLACHRGLVPTKKPRLMLWARYGLDAPASLPAPVRSARSFTALENTRRNRYVNRCLFEEVGGEEDATALNVSGRQERVSLDRFHSGDGRRTEKGWVMDLGKGDRFILGGPYAEMEPGEYEATFEVDCIDIEGPEKELRLYITDSLDRELAVQSIRQFPIEQDARRVLFSVDHAQLKIEFRIHCYRFSRGQLCFTGLVYKPTRLNAL